MMMHFPPSSPLWTSLLDRVLYHDRPPWHLSVNLDAFMLALQAYLSHIKAIPIAHARAVGISRMGTENILKRFLEYHCPPAQCSRGAAGRFPGGVTADTKFRRTVVIGRTSCNVDQAIEWNLRASEY